MQLSSTLGATYLGDNCCQFVVWAPMAEKIAVHILSPQNRLIALERGARGYHQAVAENVSPGSLYLYQLDGRKERPDPASWFQPEGVGGPSQIVAPFFSWEDSHWFGLFLHEYIIYELHVGAFTPEGTFDAIVPYLNQLKELGVSAVELMPVTQFPGNRNWGYDSVYPVAVQNSYGGPEGLKHLVNCCHQEGLAVVLDVVYNHFGPEGNYFGDFGPYFTDRYHTPWGKALNFDGPYSTEVRRYFIENALYWVTEFHIDTLRLDALHAIFDASPQPFLKELTASVHEQSKRLNRRIYLIGESDANDVRLIKSPETGGYGLDAQWNDDFHHSLHVLLTGEKTGYYQDFGYLRELIKAFSEGFVYSGGYSSYRRRRHGTTSRHIPAQRFVVFAQNHDQVGNRMRGERLSQLVPFDGMKLAAGVVLLSPFIPLLFMGEEYGEIAPFQYFTSYSELSLIEATRQGRRQEFAAFEWSNDVPDPQDESTFRRAKINHDLCQSGHHKIILEFYKKLIALRRENAALAYLSKDNMEVTGYQKARLMLVRRWHEENEIIMAFNFGDVQASPVVPIPDGRWCKLLDSADEAWQGNGSSTPAELNSEGKIALPLEAKSFVLFTKERKT